MSGASLALSNLRGVVILIVLGFHSLLAYLDFLPAGPYRFDAPPYNWQAFAIIDSQRFFLFDLFCAWQDVCLMSIMFFLSGLFVWPSLTRKGSRTFLSDRLWRIGLPFAAAVIVLVPIAYYPTYRVSALDPSLEAYWRQYQALPFWPSGPQWFLWQLLTFNLIATALHALAPQWGERLAGLAAIGRERPLRFFAWLAGASALGYLPLALLFSPWDWSHYGVLGFQLSRPLHYAVYFFAGAAIGAYGLDRGLLAVDGPLARHWRQWLVAATIGFALWMAPTSFIVDNAQAPLLLQIAAGLGFVLACASGCFCLMAAFLRFACSRRNWLDSLSVNAYVMYLIHYPFVVWLQFTLLDAPLIAIIKASIVFGGTLAASWTLALGWSSLSVGPRAIGARR